MSGSAQVVVESSEGEGARRSTVAEHGITLLDALRRSGVEITATCGARGRCQSCRVRIVSGKVPPPTVQDTVQLGFEAVREGFRLACQTHVIDDVSVIPAPPRAESGHQLLGSGADVLADDCLSLAPGIVKRLVKATAPVSEHHQSSDWEEVLKACSSGTDAGLAIEIVRRLPSALREADGAVTVTTFNGRVIGVEAGDAAGHCYGMAFDVGTTSVVGSLMDLQTGEELAAVGSLNAQAAFGGDLMSRIAYAQFDSRKLQTLRAKVLNQINDLVREACGKAGVRHEHIYKIVIVGNTSMHHILLGIDVSHVGLAPYAPVIRAPLVLDAGELPLKVAPRAKVCTLPLVAGFVGADTIACVLATRIYESVEMRALVDIGTNGEVVMGNRDRLVACSAPAGPAFEGAQIRHGMRGANGAIERVRIDSDVHCTVIGNHPALGICGSGLLDACAAMIDAGILQSSGLIRRKGLDAFSNALRKRILSSGDGSEFVLVWAEETVNGSNITLTQADVRQLQLAKSAIHAGVVMLQSVMQVGDSDIAELMLCGGFGNYIDVASAVKTRLLPALPLERISYVGNAALIGAQMALLSEVERERANSLAARIEHVALAAHPAFQDIFVDGMRFGERQTACPDL